MDKQSSLLGAIGRAGLSAAKAGGRAAVKNKGAIGRAVGSTAGLVGRHVAYTSPLAQALPVAQMGLQAAGANRLAAAIPSQPATVNIAKRLGQMNWYMNSANAARSGAHSFDPNAPKASQDAQEPHTKEASERLRPYQLLLESELNKVAMGPLATAAAITAGGALATAGVGGAIRLGQHVYDKHKLNKSWEALPKELKTKEGREHFEYIAHFSPHLAKNPMAVRNEMIKIKHMGMAPSELAGNLSRIDAPKDELASEVRRGVLSSASNFGQAAYAAKRDQDRDSSDQSRFSYQKDQDASRRQLEEDRFGYQKSKDSLDRTQRSIMSNRDFRQKERHWDQSGHNVKNRT
jgi:hypothetical protein